MNNTPETRLSRETLGVLLPWILRIGVAGCFIGHGAFGIITKSAWVPYFAVGGIDEPLAWKLMPVVGAMDILMGIAAIVWPCRALFAWAAIWAVWTASLRPLTGEPIWEMVERAGNYGVPIAILVVVGLKGSLFGRIQTNWTKLLDDTRRQRLAWTLKLTTVLLLAGHAGLGLFSHKAGLAHHYAALGLGDSTALVAGIGAFEFLLVALVFIFPRPGLLVGVCLWKIATESLFVVAGSPFWEVIERFGSYAAPLALAALVFCYQPKPALQPATA